MFVRVLRQGCEGLGIAANIMSYTGTYCPGLRRQKRRSRHSAFWSWCCSHALYQKVKFGNSYTGRLLRYAVCWMVAVQFVVVQAQQTAATSPISRTAPLVPAKNIPDTNSLASSAEAYAATNLSDPKLLGGLIETVSDLLAILPLWKTVGEGEPLRLSIGVNVINLVSLQWYFNGQPIPGANTGILDLQSVTAAQVGRYELRATLLGITLASIPTDVQINKTDDTVDRNVAAFDQLSAATALQASAKNAPQKSAKSGTTSHGYSGTQIFNTFGATKDTGEPNHCGISGGKSEWFTWQSPTNGVAIIHTDGSNFDTILAVYIGPGDSYSTLTNVACDNNSGANGQTSRVTFQATAGTIYYIAVDGVNGASGTVKLHFIVGTPPAITAQPASRTAALGALATLRVSALGFPAPRYQWIFNGAHISGATNPVLTLPEVSQENVGQYAVRITNAFNSLLSTSADLLLETPLHFTNQRALSNGFHLSLQGPAGIDYLIECSSDLTIWMPLATNRTQTGLFDYLDTRVTGAIQFYRARPSGP